VPVAGDLSTRTNTTVSDWRVGRSEPGTLPSAGSRIGRFVVLEPIGSGGMGTVYRAFDPELNRDIALKLQPASAPRRRWRLLREAQALAQLSHPNVVSVFDVLTRGDDVFIAMELVEGRTLRQLVDEDHPPAARVLELYAAAGRGLAAAHAAGLVHRDFKPDNAVVGADGRVRVLDFGLARSVRGSVDSPAEPKPDEDCEQPPPWALDGRMTRAGVSVGTPSYMAPEQVAGGAVDARADQFAFAVALREALGGDDAVSARVRRAIRRALADAPHLRFPSMDALLAELAPRRARWARRLIAAAVALSLGAVAILFGATGDRPVTLCRGAGERLAGAWDAAARRGLLAAWPDAPAAAERVAASVDRYAAGWVAMRTDACEATHVRGDQSEHMLDLRMQCLDRRRDLLAALVSVLSDRSARGTVGQAAEAIATLPPLAECADAPALLPGVAPPPDPTTARRVDSLRRAIDQAEAQELAGFYRAGADRIAGVVREAEELAYRPVLAEALERQGSLLAGLGKGEEAEEVLRRAIKAAGEAHDEVLLARAAIDLVHVVGSVRGRSADGLSLADFAAAAIARVEHPGDLDSQLENVLAGVHMASGRFDEARAELERAQASWPASLGRDHPRRIAILSNLAQVYGQLGLYPEAIEASQKALAAYQRLYGPDHPRAAREHHRLGVTYSVMGRSQEAVDSLERAISIYERLLGPEDPELARALIGLGLAENDLGRGEEAVAALRRSLSIAEKVFGRDHLEVANTLRGLASVLASLGRSAEAEKLLERAVAIRQAAQGADHPEVGAELAVLGDVRLHAGRTTAAWNALDRARAILEKDGKSGDLQIVYASLAEVRRAQKRTRAAIALYKQAAAAFERTGGNLEEHKQVLLDLAAAERAVARRRRAR
jgi:tetratricopeptide (TPR) repeat protein/predicted Ser/Thr protein kinase